MKNLDLRSAARTIDLPAGDVDTVVARGATLANRKRRIVAGGLTLSLVAASAGIYARMNQTKPIPLAVEGAAAHRGDSGIKWEKIDTKSGLGFTTTLAAESLYAVSTAPGRAAPNDTRRLVWHSEDGVEWNSVADLGNDLYLSNLTDKGTRLYGVGTGPATAAVAGRKPVADLVVGSSDNGGRSWTRQTLPVDMAAISAKSRSVSVYAVDVATTKDAVVAIASLAADLDVPKLVPAGQTAPNGWALAADGVDVLGNGPDCPAGMTTAPPNAPDKRALMQAEAAKDGPSRQYAYQCYSADGTATDVTPQQTHGVKAHYTWAQLNVDNDLLRAVRSEPMVFRADAGSTAFQRVDAAEVAALDGPGLLEQDGDGLLLVGQQGNFPDGYKPDGPAPALLRSVDGKTWTTGVVPPGYSYASAIGRLGSRTAMLGETASGPTLWVSDGGGEWSATSLASAVDPNVRDKANISLVSAAVGRLGVVAVVAVMRDQIAERGGVTLTDNGYTMRVLNDRWTAVATDSTGKEVARSDNVMDGSTKGALRSTNDGAVALFDPITNAKLATFGADSIKNTMGRATRDSAYTPTYRVIASRDGATWSDDDVNTLAGDKIVNVLRVLMTGEKAVVAVAPADPANSKTPAKQVALVATPR
jgi:hypothetical protein